MSITARRGVSPKGGADPVTRDPLGERARRIVRTASRFLPISIVMVLVPIGVGIGRVLSTLNQPFISFGDVAVLESAVRDTLGGHQLLGPYSHFGWFHPGPAYFYVMAPVYGLFGESARTMFLGAFLINAASALAIVVVIRWRAGEWAARWGALVVAGLLFFTEASSLVLYNPWNPSVLALPFLLTMVLAAAAATGSTLSLIWAALVGSFVIGSELGTAPAVLAVLVVGTALWGWAVWKRRAASPVPHPLRWARPSRHIVALTGSALLVVLVWVPPLIQQTTQTPGNAGRIVSFFEHPPTAEQAGGRHTRGQAVRGVAEYAATLPLKSDAFPCCEPNQFAGPNSAYTGRLVIFGGGVLVGVGVAVIGWRRRHQLAMGLGAISVVASGAAVVSATQVVGPLYEHLLWWTATVLVPAWIGAGLLAIDFIGTRQSGPLSTPVARRITSGALVVACAVPCLALAWSLFRDPPIGYGDDPGRQVAARLVEQPVRAMHVRDLRVEEADPDQFGLAASVVVELQKAGVAVHLEPPASTSYGPQEQVRGPDQALLVVSGPHDPAPAVSTAGATHLGTVEDMQLWLRPLPAT
ncbi:MAG TPA: hypothetical protein VGF64_15115 [Acidimicrobiales bacterium]